MIIKNGKQIGFIYKNGKRIDKIIRHGKVYFEQGFLREKTSTTLPITFGGVGKDLKDYRVYGNTYQNSTSGINEWNSFNKEQTDKYKVLEDGTIQLINSSSTTNGYTAISKSLKEMCPNLNVGDTVYLYIVSTWYRKEIYSSSIGSWTNGNSKTLTQQMLDSNIILYGGYQTTSTIKIMITKNQYYDTYEPYTNGASPNPDYPQEIVSCGDRTKNLCFTDFDNWESGQYNTNGEKSNSESRIRLKELLKVETGKTYYFNTFSEFNYIIRTYDENKNFISSIGVVANENTITVSTAKYLGITIYNPNDSSLVYSDYETLFENGTIRPLICLNSETDKSYEPYGYKIPVNVNNSITNIYLDEPLRKIKDGIYVDYIDFINQKVYRQLGETKINDYSGFSHNGTRDGYMMFLTPTINNLKLNISNISTSNIMFCNYTSQLRGSTASSKIRFNIPHKYLGTTQSSTPAEARQALANFMSGKTMEFVYPLQTPTEEDIELPNISTINGNNTLSIETEITPSQVYIKYRNDN